MVSFTAILYWLLNWAASLATLDLWICSKAALLRHKWVDQWRQWSSWQLESFWSPLVCVCYMYRWAYTQFIGYILELHESTICDLGSAQLGCRRFQTVYLSPFSYEWKRVDIYADVFHSLFDACFSKKQASIGHINFTHTWLRVSPWYLSNASAGRDPSSRIFLMLSSFCITEDTKCSLLSWLLTQLQCVHVCVHDSTGKHMWNTN